MDLAKIRRKALSRLKVHPIVLDGPESAVGKTEAESHQHENMMQPCVSGRETVEHMEVIQPETELVPYVYLPQPVIRGNRRAPLDVILAGRASAGCDMSPQADPHDLLTVMEPEFNEYLCIQVSDETYGIDIMQIKEIIKPRQITEVPRSPSIVHGVISLRGVIVPVLDISDRLGLKRAVSIGRERIVVVKSVTGDCFTGLLVDQVTQVTRISAKRIEPAPVPLNGIDRNFVRGIGRTDNQMIIILNIDEIIDIQLT